MGWYFYSNRSVVSFEYKNYHPDEIEEAIEELDFEVNLPTYMAHGALTGSVVIYNNYTQGVQLLDIKYNYNDGKGSYGFYSSYRSEPIESVIVKDGNYSWVEIQINGNRGLQAVPEHSGVSERVMFKTDKNIYYEVTSHTLDFEEMIKVLESIEFP